jgi:protocatechuate 3,4-dioxygenase beta subunit
MGQARFTATADREGRYALEDVAAGEAFVGVRGGGWVSADVGDVREGGFNPFAVQVAGGASLTLDLVAVPAGRIEGKALDAAGAPVVGASVSAQVSGLPGGAQVPWRLTQALGTETVATSAEGTFALGDLVPGLTYNLSATAPDQPPANAGPFTVAAETPATAEIRFPAARYAEVRVLLEGDETPVPEANVSLVYFHDQGNWSNAAQAPTDREGRARVGPVGPGSLAVLVSGEAIAARGGPPTQLEGSKEGPGPFTLTVRVQRGRTIEGRVVKPDGTPAAGAWVNAQAKDGSTGQGASTGADGSFTIKSLGAGSFNLNANLNQHPKPQLNGFVAAEAGATGVLLTLVEAANTGREAILVRVLDDRGEPVRSANVRLQAQGSSWGNGLHEGAARFEFDKQNNGWVLTALANGTLYVDVSGARGWADLPLSTGPTRVGPLAADQREVEVRLAAERAIEGRVLNADGSPVRGVLVRASSAATADGSPPSQGEGRSDELGRFRVGGLGEGEHTLSAMVPPDYLAPQAVTAPAGARNVELNLRRGVSARVRVRDADGQPVANAHVGLAARAPDVAPQPGQRGRRARHGQTQVSVVTVADGTALLRGLDPDLQWVLSVAPNRDDLLGHSQDRWTPADVEVRLERGYAVSGVVRDPQGRALPGSQVMRKVGENGWNGVGVNQDGTFKITGLERGHVTLAAWAPGVSVDVNDPSVQVLTVAAGTQDLVLTVDPGFELVVRITNVGDRGPNGRNAQVALYAKRGEHWAQVGHQQDGDGSGRVAFRGLKADERHTVWVAPVAGNEYYGLLTDVKPGGGETTLRLERGGTIQGRVTVAGTHESLWVGAGNDMGCWVSGTVDPDGRYEIRGVPYGMRWRVHAWANVGKQHWSAQAEASVGGVADLRVEAPPTR